MDTQPVICPDCAESVPDLIAVPGSHDVCQLCAELYTDCALCGAITHDSDVSVATNEHGEPVAVCSDCFDNDVWVCHRCDTRFTVDAQDYDVEGYRYCETCRDYYAVWCEWHDEYHQYDCGENGRGHRIIEPYSTKPYWNFARSADEAPDGGARGYFGVELEVECQYTSQYDAAEIIDAAPVKGQLLVKEDGSIYDGFEIVSHPRTLKAWREWHEYRELLEQLQDNGVRAWSHHNVGLHVHANKRQFESTSHRARFDYLINHYRSFWVKGAAARVSSYAVFSNEFNIRVPATARVHGRTAHTAAVNWSNDKTVEVRMFRPAVNFDRVLGCVETVSAVSNFSRIISARDLLAWNKENVAPQRLIDFAVDNGYAQAVIEMTASWNSLEREQY